MQLRLKRTPQPLTANVDAKLIKQAVLNLMLNGVQAMSNGGELILCLERVEDIAAIHVTDTGSGIAAEVLPNIFRAYYTTKRGGTGIGLAMTKRIAEEHAGSIEVHSEIGKGTDFVIKLPVE